MYWIEENETQVKYLAIEEDGSEWYLVLLTRGLTFTNFAYDVDLIGSDSSLTRHSGKFDYNF